MKGFLTALRAFYRVRAWTGISAAQWRTYLSLYRLFWSLWCQRWHQSPHRGRWSAKTITTTVLNPLKCCTAPVKLDLTERLARKGRSWRVSRRKRAQLCSPAESRGSIRSHQIPPASGTLGSPPQWHFPRPSAFCLSRFATFAMTSRMKFAFFKKKINSHWVSISIRSCRKSGFLTCTLPMVLPSWDRDGRGQVLRGAAALRVSNWGSGRWCGDAALSGAAGLTSLPLWRFFFFTSRMGLGPHWCWEEPINKCGASVFGSREVEIRGWNYASRLNFSSL